VTSPKSRGFSRSATKDDGRRLEIRHAAERNALWALVAQLEKQLVAPLRSGYVEALQTARAKVEEQGGPW
jgi:hypothetical protein